MYVITLPEYFNFYITQYWIAANEHSPGRPKTPTIPIVYPLIGTCNPISPPAAFNKKIIIPPIANLRIKPPMKRSDLEETPEINNKLMTITKIKTTKIVSKKNPPFF